MVYVGLSSTDESTSPAASNFTSPANQSPQSSPAKHPPVRNAHSGSSTSYSNWDEVDDTVDSFGHLALDDMKEVGYFCIVPAYMH